MTVGLLAVIPARGGSKRIPHKNVRPLLGQPLLHHTVQAARRSGLFDAVVVSTDSPAIAAIAQEAGAAVPFLREPALADDLTPASAVTLDALRRIDPRGTRFLAVAQLMANCPLRTGDDIVESHRQFDTTGARSQISVTRYGWQNPWWAMERDEAMVLRPLFPERLAQRSQDLPELFCPTGAVWWATADCLREAGTYHTGDRTGWLIPWPRGLDIDTEEDWTLAEALLSGEGRPGGDQTRG